MAGWYGSGSTDELIAQAIEAEKGGNLEAALELVSQAGAKILAGQKFEFNVDMPLGCVAEWVNGLDSISAAMVGGDDYGEM